jgi:hypothetical protein
VRRLRSAVSDARLLTGLVVAHLVVKAALWPTVSRAPLSGDEGGYQDGGMALSNLVRDLAQLRAPDVGELQANLVSNGWFMPGMSAVLTPLYLADPDPGVAVVRAYAGVVSSALLIGVALWTRRRLGHRYACALMVVPGLVPMWLVFSYSAWADALAGLVVVAILLVLHGLVNRMAAGERIRMRQGVVVGVLAVSCLYLRSSALPLTVGVLLLLGLAALAVPPGAVRRHSVATAVAAAAVFVALLAPWSTAASQVMGSTVTTTTTMRLSLAITFGEVDDLCFGPCAPPRSSAGLAWFDGVRYSREVAAATDRSEVDVQSDMAAYALRDLTPGEYAGGVGRNFKHYLLVPTEFTKRFLPASDWVGPLVVIPTKVLLLVAGAAATLVMLDLRRLGFPDRVLRVLLKLLLMASLLQPFFHAGSGRYWPLFAPLLGIATAFLLGSLRSRPDTEQPDVRDRRGSRAVAVADVAATAVAVGTAAVLVLLSI